LRNASLVSFFCTATSGSSNASWIALAASVQFDVLPVAQRGQGLESRNCQRPGGNGGSAFELASLTPHIEKNLADEVFRDLFIPHEPEPEAKHPDMVPSVQHLDPSDQDVVRGRLCRTQWPSRWVGRIGVACGSMAKQDSSNYRNSSPASVM
jgi:hypothetical protein